KRLNAETQRRRGAGREMNSDWKALYSLSPIASLRLCVFALISRLLLGCRGQDQVVRKIEGARRPPASMARDQASQAVAASEIVAPRTTPRIGIDGKR